MRIRIWGARGSLPYSMTSDLVKTKIKGALTAAIEQGLHDVLAIDDFIERQLPFPIKGAYGGNTPCVEIIGGEGRTICDAGSGLRDLGSRYLQSELPQPSDGEKRFHLFISHLHWDHLQGFPFFVPAYLPGFQIDIYGGHQDLENAFRRQMEHPFFPVRFDDLRSTIAFHQLEAGREYAIGGFQVTVQKQQHPGDSYGFRFKAGETIAVYSTDSEHQSEADQPDYGFLDFIRNADALVMDTQYTAQEAMDTKLHWGHSHSLVGVELANRAGVKRLILFHHDPRLDDFQIEDNQDRARKYLRLMNPSSRLEIAAAYEGMEIELQVQST